MEDLFSSALLGRDAHTEVDRCIDLMMTTLQQERDAIDYTPKAE
jgi:hypothetical protein